MKARVEFKRMAMMGGIRRRRGKQCRKIHAKSRRDVGLSFDAFRSSSHWRVRSQTSPPRLYLALLFCGLGVQSSSVLDKTRLLSNHINDPERSAQPHHLNA